MEILIYGEHHVAFDKIARAITMPDGSAISFAFTTDELKFRDIAFEIVKEDEEPTLVGIPELRPDFSINAVAQKIALFLEASSFKKVSKPVHEINLSSVKEVESALEECRNAGLICFDLETTGLKHYGIDFPTLLVFNHKPGYVYYVALEHIEGLGKAASIEIMEMLVTLIQDKSVIKVGQNLKFDLLMIAGRVGRNFRPYGLLYDTQIMHHLVDENQRHNLETLTSLYEPGHTGFKKVMKGVNWATIGLEDLVPYACKDAHVTLLVFSTLLIELNKDSRLVDYYHNMSVPLLYTLKDMAYNGVPIDDNLLDDLTVKYAKTAEQMEAELYQHPSMLWYLTKKTVEVRESTKADILSRMGKHREGSKQRLKYEQDLLDCETLQATINLNSGQQVSDFFEAIGVQAKGGKTNKHALDGVDHPWVDLWQAYKQVVKMVGTYYGGFKNHSSNGRLYGNFLQTGTVTHRLSSTEPSLQNIPVRTRIKDERAIASVKDIKKLFYAPEGWSFIACDMSQAELRTIANVSEDQTMIDVYNSGKDIHSLTASRILGMDYDKFLEMKASDPKKFNDARFGAKGANFGMVYRISANGYIAYLKQQYGMEIDADTEAIHRNAIFGTYKKLRNWHNTYVARAQKFKQVRSMFGTCRRLPSIDDSNGAKRSGAERDAINAPIQATSAQYSLLAMAVLNEMLPKDIAYLTLQIHDAVYIQCKTEHVDLVREALEACFNHPPYELFDINSNRLKVPMAIDVEVGTNWSNVK